MTWFGWLLIALMLISTLATIGLIGQPRKPISNGAAIFATVLNGLLAMGILLVGTGSLR